MGREVPDEPALPQTSVEVLPTRTIYTFEGEGVLLTLTFMTPLLPEEVDLLSRPVTYLTWQARATDGKEHEISFGLKAHGEIAVNEAGQVAIHNNESIADMVAFKIGAKEQPVLVKKGDDLRIDWGYLYIASPMSQNPSGCHACLDHTDKAASVNSPGPAADVEMQMQFHFPAEEKPGNKPVSRWLILAYDDLYSIQYMKKNLRPYWRRNGWEAADLLKAAAKDYESLKKRCEAFDAELMTDLRNAGGENYAKTAGRFRFARRTIPTAASRPRTFSIRCRRSSCSSGRRWRNLLSCRS